MTLPSNRGGSATLSVTGKCQMGNGDGASMRRSHLKRQSIRSHTHHVGNRMAGGCRDMPAGGDGDSNAGLRSRASSLTS